MSLRRLAVLVRELPADAATVRAIDKRAEWSITDYLLAALIDVAQTGNWLTVEMNKKKNARNPRPKPIERPGERREKPKKLSGRELAEWLGKVG